MARKKCPAELRPLSPREEKLCVEVINRGFVDNLNAYLAAGYHPTTDNAIVIACKKIAEPKIQRRLNELARLKEVKQTLTTSVQVSKLQRIEVLAEKIGNFDAMIAAIKEENVLTGLRIAEQPADSEEAQAMSMERKQLLGKIARYYVESKEIANKPVLALSDGKGDAQDEPGSTNDVTGISEQGTNKEGTSIVSDVPIEKERE
jgi:hypothetical protein